MNNDADFWMNFREGAAYARIPVVVFRRLVREGRGPTGTGALRFWRVRRSEMDRWLDAGIPRPTGGGNAAEHLAA